MEHMQLLDSTRIGVLLTTRQNGTAIGVPVWFDWDGETLRCFAAKDSKKMKRLARDPRASLLVTNVVGEPEAWIAFDGEFSIKNEGGLALAEKLAARYWNLDEPTPSETLALWQAHPDALALLEMKPSAIRTGS